MRAQFGEVYAQSLAKDYVFASLGDRTIEKALADGEHVLVNTEPQRQKARNVARDPRVTVLIRGDDPYDWAEVRGHVVETVGGDEARRHIDELSERYTGAEYRNPIGPQGRIILKVAADKINTSKSRRR